MACVVTLVLVNYKPKRRHVPPGVALAHASSDSQHREALSTERYAGVIVGGAVSALGGTQHYFKFERALNHSLEHDVGARFGASTAAGMRAFGATDAAAKSPFSRGGQLASAPRVSIPTRPPADTVLLVRGHWLTRAMLNRISAWATDCAAATPPIDIALSLDTTIVGFETARTALGFFRHQRHVDVLLHTYNTTDMLTAYPTLAEAMEASGPKNRNKSAAYGFHTEAMMVWYAQLGSLRERYKHVWVFEADVGFSGENIAKLLRKHVVPPCIRTHFAAFFFLTATLSSQAHLGFAYLPGSVRSTSGCAG